jgi:hypothetical protein
LAPEPAVSAGQAGHHLVPHHADHVSGHAAASSEHGRQQTPAAVSRRQKQARPSAAASSKHSAGQGGYTDHCESRADSSSSRRM